MAQPYYRLSNTIRGVCSRKLELTPSLDSHKYYWLVTAVGNLPFQIWSFTKPEERSREGKRSIDRMYLMKDASVARWPNCRGRYAVSRAPGGLFWEKIAGSLCVRYPTSTGFVSNLISTSESGWTSSWRKEGRMWGISCISHLIRN